VRGWADAKEVDQSNFTRKAPQRPAGLGAFINRDYVTLEFK